MFCLGAIGLLCIEVAKLSQLNYFYLMKVKKILFLDSNQFHDVNHAH